jgi:aspartokinase-like uncharacterized kinase
LLVPGGGEVANAVRQLDRCHGLGEEDSHWLALRAVALNAYFLGRLLPDVPVLATPEAWERVAILDVFRFACADEEREGCLPHCWEVTSDSLAARVAIVAGAAELVLLKSVTIPPEMNWEEAGRAGLVDARFASVLAAAPGLRVRSVNFRAWQP